MYEVYYKNILVFKIELDKTGRGSVVICDKEHMPFDIYLEESDDIDDRLNNIFNFNAWCAGRILPLDRKYAKEILNYYGYSQRMTDNERAKIALSTRCLSINDCYWVRKDAETVKWEDVNLFQNSLENAVFEVALFGTSPTVTNSELVTPDISTDGTAPKAWLRNGNSFYLLKGDVNGSVKKEVEASKILSALGIANIGYESTFFNGMPVSKCRCYTDENTNLVRAEWFDLWCKNNNENLNEYISKFRDQFDKMNLADYLVGNSDEHSQNWGFLYDSNMTIISLNPLMDYDHAFESSPNSLCLPAKLLGQNITQEEMARSILQRHPDWIRKDVDLSRFHYGSFVQARIAELEKSVPDILDTFDENYDPRIDD